jgi:ABC-type sugar transport system substrate-binding protein
MRRYVQVKKRLIWVLILAVLVGVVPFVGLAKTKAITIGYVTMNMGSDSNVACYKGFTAYAKKRGWKVLLGDAQADTTKVSSLMINFVNKRVDALVMVCGEKSIIDMGVEAADKAKIPVFLGDTENIRDTVINSTSNCWAMGAFLGSQMIDRIRAVRKGSGPSYVCIIGMNDLYVHRQRQQMVEAVVKSPENKDIELLATDSVPLSNWADGSYDIAKAWITKYGKKISAIIGTWDGISWNIARAITSSGYNKNDMFTMSIDGSEQTYDLIRKGSPFVGVIAQNFAGWAKGIGDAIQAVVVEGKSPKSVVSPSRTIYTPYVWVDATNVPAKGQGDKVFQK